MTESEQLKKAWDEFIDVLCEELGIFKLLDWLCGLVNKFAK